jgi:hypothetical protein
MGSIAIIGTLLRFLFRPLAVAIARNGELTTSTFSRPAQLTTGFNVTDGVEIMHESEKYETEFLPCIFRILLSFTVQTKLLKYRLNRY